MSRELWLEQTDEQLLGDCEIDRYRASGPGGQKRNKTESAVRLRHGPSGLAAHATESRSQHDNKREALRRLRAKIAIELRQPAGDSARELAATLAADSKRSDQARRSTDYLRQAAALLDVVAAADYAVGDAARAIGATTAAVVKAVKADPRLHRWVNQQRAQLELKPLG
jgi:protein subunit release factor B